jgi:hypothetical protein
MRRAIWGLRRGRPECPVQRFKPPRAGATGEEARAIRDRARAEESVQNVPLVGRQIVDRYTRHALEQKSLEYCLHIPFGCSATIFYYGLATGELNNMCDSNTIQLFRLQIRRTKTVMQTIQRWMANEGRANAMRTATRILQRRIGELQLFNQQNRDREAAGLPPIDRDTWMREYHSEGTLRTDINSNYFCCFLCVWIVASFWLYWKNPFNLAFRAGDDGDTLCYLTCAGLLALVSSEGFRQLLLWHHGLG